MSDTRRRWLVGTLATLLVFGVVALQATHVHVKTGRWALSATAAPTAPPFSVTYEHRQYERGDRVELPGDAVARGQTKNGSPVHKPAGDEDLREVTVIYVSRGDHTWAYSLVGGP